MTNKTLKSVFTKITKTIILTMIVFAAFSANAFADNTSVDLTPNVTYKINNGAWAGATIDNDYRSYWYTNNAAYKYFQIESEEDIKYLYVCYAFKPSELAIQTSIDGKEWVDIAYETNDEYYHKTYTFDTPVNHIRIRGTDTSQGKFGIVEFRAFSEGTLPDYVQSWQPTYDKTDMLIFSAHPDDEAVFFCGLIPYYSSEKDKKVTTVYMTASDPCRRSEALNYQWAIHQTNLPIFAYFEDVYESETSNYTKSRWGEKKTIDYMVSVIRQKKPDVIVSHDLNGEYGHGNHIFTAQCLLQAVTLSNDPAYHPESYEEYGLHEIKKLYLHLYPENKVHLDFLDEPLDEFDGLTAIEVAEQCLPYYASQIKYEVVRVHGDESEFSCYEYGLAYSTVGDDKKGNSMFENIDPEITPTPIPTATPSPTIIPTPAITIAPTHDAIPANSKSALSKNYIILFCVIAGLVLIICLLFIISLAKK